MKSRTRQQREQPPDGGPCPGVPVLGRPCARGRRLGLRRLRSVSRDRQTDIAYIGFGLFSVCFIPDNTPPPSHSWKTEVGAGGTEGAGGECRPRPVSREWGGGGESFGKKEGGPGGGLEGNLGRGGGNVTLSQRDASLQERWGGGLAVGRMATPWGHHWPGGRTNPCTGVRAHP